MGRMTSADVSPIIACDASALTSPQDGDSKAKRVLGTPDPHRRHHTPMHPVDLAAERHRRHRAACKALAQEVRHAALSATPAELIGLRALRDDVQAGELDIVEAREFVSRLRDEQRDRANRAA